MNGHRRVVAIRVALVILVNLAGFALVQQQFRAFETFVSRWLVDAVIGSHHTFEASTTSIGVLPNHGTPFIAIITPSCSALPAVIALLCLSTTTTKLRRRRRVAAAGLAIVTITAGNILRIAASTGVGVLEGRSSLVLFHDWIGGLFTFAYTMGGYMLMLYVLLPSGRDGAPPAERASAPAGAIAPVELEVAGVR